MDPLTHTATGLFLSRAGLKKWTPLATPILLLAANAPDIDIVTAAGGSTSYLHYHRHLTHSLIAMPAIALLPVLLVRAAGRKPIRWMGAFFAALIAVASHLLLDFTNTYGIRLLLPFSARWLRLDITNVFDLWIWGFFLFCILGPLIGRLVGSEIASSGRVDQNHGRGFAWVALIGLLFYEGGRAVMHERATAVLESRIYQGATPSRVAAFPHFANPMRWRGLVETPDFYAVAPLDLAADFDPGKAPVLYKSAPDPALDVAGREPAFQEFLRFSQFPLWRVTPAPDLPEGKLVTAIDLRFANPGPIATAILDARLRPVRSWFSWGLSNPK